MRLFRIILWTWLTLSLVLLSSCKPPGLKWDRDRPGEDSLILVRNTRVVVGLSPDQPGEIVVYRSPWGRNLLLPPHSEQPATVWNEGSNTASNHWLVKERSSSHVRWESGNGLKSIQIRLHPDGLLERSWHGTSGLSSSTQWHPRCSLYFLNPEGEGAADTRLVDIRPALRAHQTTSSEVVTPTQFHPLPQRGWVLLYGSDAIEVRVRNPVSRATLSVRSPDPNHTPSSLTVSWSAEPSPPSQSYVETWLRHDYQQPNTYAAESQFISNLWSRPSLRR